jgi:hypothetical protein
MQPYWGSIKKNALGFNAAHYLLSDAYDYNLLGKNNGVALETNMQFGPKIYKQATMQASMYFPRIRRDA